MATKRQNAKKSGKKALTICAVVLAVLIIGGLFTYSQMATNGFFLRHTYSVKSEHFNVSNTMMTYFFQANYSSAMSSSYASYYTQMGLDTSTSLKSQQYPGASGDIQTWYDYFMQSVTIPAVKQMLVLAEAARADGYELTEDDQDNIDAAIDAIKNAAKEQDVTVEYYVLNHFGYGMKLKDVRAALELQQLASGYSEKDQKSFSFTEDEWQTYFDENKDSFRNVDYLSYTFNGEDLVPETEELTDEEISALASEEAADATVSATEEATGEATEATEAVTDAEGGTEAVSETEAATDTEAVTEAQGDTETEGETEAAVDEAKLPYYEIAKSYADRAAAAKTEDEFKAVVEEYLRNERYPEEEADAAEETGDESADDTDTAAREENITSALDALLTEGAAYSESNEISVKLFEAKTGATVTDDSGADSGKYVVYFVTKADYVEDYATKKANAIIIEAEDGDESVQETVDKVNAELDKDSSDENFAALAAEYSVGAADAKYEKINKSFFPSDEITEWLFDDERVAGDRGTFTFTEEEDGETHTHYCVIQYTGDDIMKWQSDADSALKNQAYNDKYQEFSDAYESKIEVSLVDLYKIPN